MKSKIIKTIIPILICLIAIASIIPLIGNENQVEWFGTGIYQILVIGFWIAFYLIFLLVGLFLNKSSLSVPWTRIIEVFKFSIFGTIIIVAYGSISHTVDFNNWQRISKRNREIYEQQEFKEYNQTVDSLQSLLKIDSSNSEAYFELGLTYRHNGEWEKSINCYRKAIQNDSSVSKYHSELAYSESINKNYCEAIEHYRIAYRLDTTKKWIKSDIERCERMKKQQVTQ